MSYAYTHESFDSDLFGFSVAKISKVSPHGSVSDTIRLMLDSFREGGIEYATYRLPADEFTLIHALEHAGFVIVDGILSFERLIENHETTMHPNVRSAVKKDRAILARIGSTIWSATRFYNDPLIPRKSANELYKQWIVNSLNRQRADWVLVYDDHEVAGYISLKKDGSIPLVGVAGSHQGKGIAKTMLSGAFDILRQKGVGKAMIETQITNIPAIRTYEAVGFRVTSSFVTLRWACADLGNNHIS